MPKAYSYIRFSTPEQLKGDSLRRQIELSERYAEKHGLELDTRLNLRDLGVSAYDGSNRTKGALAEFLRLVSDGRIERGSYLLVESLDRLSRDRIKEALGLFMSLQNAGITIVTLADEQIYSHEETNDDLAKLLYSIVVMSRANEESATKSRRGRAAWDNKRATISEKRLTARCPYWLRPTEGKQGFEFIPERVEVVKRIFQMSKNGLGTTSIVKTLNEENVPTFSDKTHGWQNSYIHKTLANRAVYGEMQLCTQRDGVITAVETIPGYYPAIMTKEEWLLIASLRSSRRTRGGVSKGEHISNLFSGLLKCGYCGSPMNMGGYVNKRANGEKRSGKYVACSNGRRGMGCKFIQWNYEDLEFQILWFCSSVDYSQILQANGIESKHAEDAKRKVVYLDDEIRLMQRKLSQLIGAIENAENGVAPKSLISRVSEIEHKLESLEAEKYVAEKESVKLQNNINVHSNFFNSLHAVITQLQAVDGSELRNFRARLSSLLRHDIVRIDLYPGGRWMPEDKIQERVIELRELGVGEEIISSFAESSSAVTKEARVLHMHFRNGRSKVVAPETNLFVEIK